jgi:hypothetical protein
VALLTDNDRGYILDQLRLAPDEVLADAMLHLNSLRDKIVAVRKLTGVAIKDEAPEEATERVNVSPGKSSITKIGSATKEELLTQLRQGTQPQAKYLEHLKLLWERGEVKFDGEVWYL